MAVPLWLNVIGTALGLGIVHVLTGPDHLSALSTLSVGKPLKIAFGLGVRWGCGHSFGLLIVAIIFFAVGRQIDLSVLSYWADLFVGIFMIVLGGWYTLKAFRERMKYLQEAEDKDIKRLIRDSYAADNANNHNQYDMAKIDVANINDDNEEQIELQEVNDDDHDKPDDHNNSNKDDKTTDDEDFHDDEEIDEETEDDVNNKDNSPSFYDNDHPFTYDLINSEQHVLNKSKKKSISDSYQNGAIILKESKDDVIPDDDMIIDGNATFNPLFDRNDNNGRTKCITRLAAFVAGIFHGIAGPGGVLGVMVALKLNDWFLSSLYLLLFFLSSIITMGIYAIIYGYCTQRITICANNKQKCAFILKIVSAIFSLIVGVLWISLTFTGTLEEWFD